MATPQSAASSYPTNQYLQIKVISPSQIIFQGQAEAISSINIKGPFDILPNHGHLITLIQTELLIHQQGQTQTIPISQGIIRCKDDQVEVYVVESEKSLV